MDILKNKNTYLQRKVEQLHQWERVLDNLIARAKKTEDKKRIELLNQIEKIKAKKSHIEKQLKRMKSSGEKDWRKEKDGLEKSWKELRDAFSNNTIGS
jgi:seryl-tRNA synthetase